ncbi:MAG: hypothetical protein FWD85_08035 [Microbacteriaceae bacterium]|nr:hypothetical protein [Microbacteriaceae bacterium]MCL2795241.1 hypothetical protein [Microbacteriaceae bacterium]
METWILAGVAALIVVGGLVALVVSRLRNGRGEYDLDQKEVGTYEALAKNSQPPGR